VPTATVAARCSVSVTSETSRDFPTPAGTEDGEELARAVGDRRLEGVEELAALGVAVDHRRVRALRSRPRVRRHREQAEGLQVSALALDGQRRDRLGLDRVADQAIGVAAKQDVPGARRLLEPSADVDDVAGREEAARGRDAGDGLAGIDPDAHRQVDAALTTQLVAQASLIGHGVAAQV
jgi:hypothetical protein